ncbi:MAG: aspartate aminotransferase family protein [Firmicutes bacterium]|nr:aspartate aminotransferase family protein [Bacillota bacterium]
MNSNEIKAIDKNKIASTYARHDMAASSGKGARCYDTDGKEYIDFTAGIGVNSLGYCDEGWIKAVTEQLNKLQHCSNLYYTEPQSKVAEMLTTRTGMQKVYFANSGAEANETAIKAARKYGCTIKGIEADSGKIITLKNSFHGRTLGAMTATGQPNYHENFGPLPAGFQYCEANNIEQLEELADGDTCAVMMELVQGEGGVRQLDRDFVEAAAELCRKRDILLIIDEVQTGIGRTGKLFAYEYFGIEPDMVTFAKGIGGGLPMGGVLFGDKTCDVLQPGNHGTTYGGNPVACAGAVEVLTRIDERFLEEVREKSSYLKGRLLEIPGVSDVSGLGLMLGVTLDTKPAADFVKEALAMGLMTLTAKEKVRLLPPLTITYEEIDKGLEIFRKACLHPDKK